MTAVVRYARTGPDARPYAVLTLDSDRNRNALSAQLLEELRAALHRAAEDDVLAVVLRAEGRAFCAGADLGEAHREGMEVSAHRLAGLLRAILAHPLPVVARIHGPVRAGGLGIVAACDLAVAGDDVTYAFTEARLGLTPAVISLSVLPRMSARVAGTAFLTAGTFDARTALESGLITHAVRPELLDEAVDELVAGLTACERQGLEATKRLLNADALMYLDDRMDDMVALSAELFASDVARRHLSGYVR
ncbi:enoyl-CoA hydratase-related protein [Nocardioides humi]|uniref:Enoyl-CoA hydratase family protein n=1 Tax=Nocardioides humi TaxID=449461 RepID=A0ABN1ZXP5_9ACTN|nr:enoyl-CoA hydratase-related protein [Nocardioides humi]